MPLDSTGTQANIHGDMGNGTEAMAVSEDKCMQAEGVPLSWSYLFVHHAKMDVVCRKLQERFPVFVHKSIVCKREGKRVRKEERPTISGLVFVQGIPEEIQKFIRETFDGLRLVLDCSRRQIAAISHEVMQPFMQLSRSDVTRIRFMPHPFGYYAEGNPLVRITSGALAGLEGCRIRIARDRCLVTSLGGMTIAIGGIQKETFENLDEYARQRRRALGEQEVQPRVALTPVQAEMDACFFTPQNRLDVMALAASLQQWAGRAAQALKERRVAEAAEMALFALEEAGSHFRHYACSEARERELQGVRDVCGELFRLLRSVAAAVGAPEALRESVVAGTDAVKVRFPFLQLP